MLIANSNLVPEWGNWEEFRRLEAMGLTMYGQMTAGSWIYIGTQGILQGTYECFAEIGRRKFGGTLAGTITLTAGLGGMGGAQPLAVTMNDGVALCIDVDAWRVGRRVETRYLDEVADSLDDADRSLHAGPRREACRCRSALVGNAAILVPQLLEMDFPADIVTDQTSAHDPLSYVPADLTPEATAELARNDPQELIRRARESMATHCRAMVGFLDKGSEVFDYGNSLRTEAKLGGFDRAFDYPGLSCPPTSVRCSARARARSGGWRCRAIRPTSPPPIRQCSTSFPTTRVCTDGSSWRVRGSRSRVCRRGSAGSDTASVIVSVCGSTRWFAPARCRRRS